MFLELLILLFWGMIFCLPISRHFISTQFPSISNSLFIVVFMLIAINQFDAIYALFVLSRSRSFTFHFPPALLARKIMFYDFFYIKHVWQQHQKYSHIDLMTEIKFIEFNMCSFGAEIEQIPNTKHFKNIFDFHLEKSTIVAMNVLLLKRERSKNHEMRGRK